MPSSAEKSDSEKRAVEVDIREAVVRFQIKTWDLAASSYCVSIKGKDPDKTFLKRFDPLPVKGASGCRKTVFGAQTSVLDRGTAKRSVIFDINSIRWLTEAEVEVYGGYFCGSLCAAAGTYRVVREQTRWEVKSFGTQVISRQFLTTTTTH